MSGVELVSIEYLGTVLILGGIALFRARQADIPVVLEVLLRWFRSK
jgi:hypothetical protein